MTSTVVSPDGSRIAFESSGAGPAMLLVHGTSATRIRWAPVREKLAARYTVHEMDRRGRGGSVAESGPYSLAREAQDVAAVAEAIGGDVYVVGHSYGALCVIAALTITREIDAVNEFRATDRLANIAAPVRMLLGTESPTYLRAATAAIAAQLPDARVVAVQGQAHQAIDLDVDQFVGLVFDFDTTTDGLRGPG